nr:HAMP domain-containing histidine kinase [Bacteriovorax sp. HI3]
MKRINIFSYFRIPIDELDPERGKFQWLVRLRWIYLLIQFCIVLPWVFFYPSYVDKKVIFLGVCFLLLVGNIICYTTLKFNRDIFNDKIVFISLVFDLFVFSILSSLVTQKLVFSLGNVFFIHVALGGILLSRNKALIFYFLTAISYVLFYSLSPAFEGDKSIMLHLFDQGILLSIFLMSNSLSIQVMQQRDRIYRVKMSAEKIDRLRAIGALSAGFSHEFATPLNTIKLKLDRLLRNSTHNNQDLDIAIKAASDCERIIRKINQAQLDKRDYLFQNVNLAQKVEVIVDSWANDNTMIHLKKKISTNDRIIMVPIINFAQCLLYALDNCAQAEGVKKVELSVEEKDLYSIIRIKDDGPGFSQYVLDRVGEPFLTTKKNGTGLGLYSIQHFCHSINGKMNLYNDGGGVVEIVIPFNQEIA